MFEKQIQEGFDGWAEGFRSAFLPGVRAPHPIELWAAFLAASALFLAADLLLSDRGGRVAWGAIAALGVVAWLAERQSVRLTSNLQMSVSVLPVLFAAVVYGPLAAMCVGASALLADFGRPYVRWVIWTSGRALAGGLAGLAASAFVSGKTSLGVLLVAVVVAGVTESITDAAIAVVTLAIRKSGSIAGTVHAMLRLLAGTIPLYTPVLAALAYVYEHISAWTVLLFFVPALAAQRLFVLYQEQRRLADDLVTVNTRLERANLSFATALVATLDARDRYTAGHSAAVAIYSRDIAERMGLTAEEQQLAHLAGLVHDIGKIGLPAGLLEKAGPLTLEERRQMESHSAIGERILGKVEDYSEIAEVVRHHHERVDGRGYPDGLADESIPLISRIIAVADAYNAMTSDRPYRDAMPSRVARLRLAQAVETQFDTSIVAAFEAILAAAPEEYRTATSAQFSLPRQENQAFGGGSPAVRSAA